MVDAPLNIFDAFCGAGGSSEGLRLALGELGMRYTLGALNHWDVAIATHEANHPDAAHFKRDIYKTPLRDLVPSGRLDLLIASPTCVYFSRSRGGKPISWDQRWGRMTPTQVVRFVKEIDVRRILIENVPEFEDWGPVHRGEKRDADGKLLEPAPPVRSRLCLEHARRFPRKACEPGKPCKRMKGCHFRRWCARLKAAGFRFEWRVLCSADFGDPTTRERFYLIGTREVGETIPWPAPTHSEDGGDLFAGALPRWRSARECIDPSIRGRSIFTRKRRLSTKTLERIYAGLVRYGWPRPFLLKLRAYIDRKPLPKFTVRDLEEWLTPVPLVARTDMHKSNALCVRSADEPVATVTTGGGLGLLEPFLDVARANARGASLDDPMRTVCAAGQHMGLVEPFVFQANQGHDRARNMRSVDEPLATVVTKTFMGLVEPLVLPQGGGGAARPTSDPLPTVATDGAVGLVVPYYGTGVAKDIRQPLPTVTTRDRFGLVVPVAHAGARRARSTDDPVPTVTGAHRGDLAFIAASFGERQGQAPRTHSLDAPVPTVCAGGSIRLVQGDLIEVDILFRMLEPHELARAMGFPAGYRFTSRKKEDLTRQIGNAVSVNTAAALIRAIFANARRRRRVA